MKRYGQQTLMGISAGVLLLSPVISGQQPGASRPARFDAGAISGLPARNVGSAQMSGRIAAVAAVDDNGRITVIAGSASGGVWKSVDGGTTFKPVFDNQDVQSIGAVAIDPTNPKMVWAGTGESWVRNSVSVGDGIYKSTDGGDHWTELAPGESGLPDKPYGRIALAVAPSKPQTVYAMIESAKSALFRSDDGGVHWSRLDASQYMVWRPFYFGNLIVDPKNPDKVFKVDGPLLLSVNGGGSFSQIAGSAHGDFHDVWIDPANPNIVFTGDDGGLWR